MLKRRLFLTITLTLLLALSLSSAVLAADPTDLSFGQSGNQEKFYGYTAGELAELGWVNNKPYSGCPGVTEGKAGWHFVHPNGQLVSMEVSFGPAMPYLILTYPGDETAVQTVGPPPGTVTGVYFETDLDATLEEAKATGIGGQDFFVLSHVCVPDAFEDLTVTKTVDTSYTREHFWDIAKKVETENGEEHEGYPKIWLFVEGSGDEKATWTVDVTYEGYEDSGHNVSGDITIENTGSLDAVITDIEDLLAGAAIAIDCGDDFELPYTLPAGETLVCTYSEDGYVEGSNVVTVTTERDEYTAEEPISWGDPDPEINKTVNIKDISYLFGDVDLGTVTAPDDAQFTYSKEFTWADYGAEGCGSEAYTNEATIVETGQSASATLKVNVQCFVYETAYAKAGSGAICFIPTFRNWGWTNKIGPGTYEWELWAAAGQCDTSKGTLVGSVAVNYGADGNVTVTYNVVSPYSLKETHVYVGVNKFPKDARGRDTVAPGQYTNASPFNGSQVYVIAHAVVGLPDPNFGPSSNVSTQSADLVSTDILFLPFVRR